MQLTSSSNDPNFANVLLVGQIYLDIILQVPHFPAEDHKLRATNMEQRRGGNIGNTGEVLAQFPRLNVWCMSALGPKDASRAVFQLTPSSRGLLDQLEQKGIKTSTCLFRQSPTPSSYIIQSSETGSRTIISNNTINDITLGEFSRIIERTAAFTFSGRAAPLDWVHFEGRNIDEAVKQIDWLHENASREGWRSSFRISVELEKPDRENIDAMMSKGDVVFFSRLFAERRGYEDPNLFLRSMRLNCKPDAVLFCTWGSQGAFCLAPDGTAHHASAIKVDRVIDPVGAGDTFIAGVIASMLRGEDLAQTMAFACETASRKVAQQGFTGLAETALQHSFAL